MSDNQPAVPATAAPGESIPPAQSLLDMLNTQHARLADMAEQLRGAWVQMSSDKVSLRYRDSLWDLANRVHHAALLLDAICGRAVAEGRYAHLAAMPHTAVDWHEVSIFGEPMTIIAPPPGDMPAPPEDAALPADPPTLPDGGSAL